MKHKKKSPFEKYKNWIGMGVVLFVFVVVLLIVGKPSQSKSKTATKKASSTETERSARAPHKKTRRSSADRLAEKAQKRLERERKREERRKGGTTGGTTSAGERASRQTRVSTKTSAETGYVLKGIFVDERGERYALFGDHRTRNGDMVAGRKIREVESDRVSVEYSGSTYEVKIGNSLF